MKIMYSPDAKDKLVCIKEHMSSKITGNIMKAIRRLTSAPRRCPSVEKMLGIQSPYYFLHVEHYLVFYRVEKDTLFVAEIFNEKENYMWKMFGIPLRTEESIDYWGE